MNPLDCRHDRVAHGQVNGDTETYCADCGLVLTVNGQDVP